MERQRSFSFKSTRFLVFSLTMSSSLLFLVFFSIWVMKSNPSVHQEILLNFSKPSPALGIKPFTVQSLIGSGGNSSAGGLKSSVWIYAHSNATENAPGIPESMAMEIFPKEKDGFGSGFTSLQENASGDAEAQSNVLGIKEKETRTTSFEKSEPSLTNEETTEKNLEDTPLRDTEPVQSEVRITEKSKEEVCDVTKGRWVYDESYPLYTNVSCPFIDDGFNCESNGRLDKDYMKWKWQPQNCEIPRFNATRMLDLIRGKRLVFVGDSINRNQWESMLCMLMGAIKDPRRVYETHGRRITKEKGDYSFRFLDYKCTVEYYVSHFLVHESKARVGQKRRPTLRIDAIDHGSSRWRGADILIFNTAHWWSHHKTKAGIYYYQEGNQVHPQLDVSTAFRRALLTWASWVDKHINPKKTQVFFRSQAPSHFRGGQWNSGGHCKEASRPLDEISVISYSKNAIIQEVINQMRTSVTFLNVSSLSEYRIDGHPSTYGSKPGNRYSSSTQDCSHWCLPGVPDTWNELLYHHLQSKTRG